MRLCGALNTIGQLRVLQWNCRSIFSASTDLHYFCNNFNLDIIILQETWLTPDKNFHLAGFRSFRLDRPSRGGGLMILVSSKLCHRAKISFRMLDLDCEILALDLCLPGYHPFSIVNCYFPSGVQSTRYLDSVLVACRKEIVLTGDFNSHHLSWGIRTDSCGRRLWEWTIDHNLSCLNKGHVTFVRGQTSSVLDLTFCSNAIKILSWAVLDSATNSDHLPVVFDITCPTITLDQPKRTYINHSKFQACLRSAISKLGNASTKEIASTIGSMLEGSRKNSEFSIPSNKRSSSRWWNDECTRDYRRRKAAWKKLLLNQSPTNWKDYQFLAGVFKRTVNRAKEEYDSRHFDYLSK